MQDSIGNSIREGDILLLRGELAERLVFEVVKVMEGGIATPNGETRPALAVMVTIPADVMDKKTAILSGVVCLRNPKSEALMTVLSGGKTQ